MESKRVTYKIKALNHDIVRYICDSEISKKNLPTPAQMQILHFIISKQNEKIYQTDIAIALNLRRATLSEILKTMEKNNLIIRVQDKNDTRKKEIILSNQAKENFLIVKHALNEVEHVITKDINKQELEIFFKILSQMQTNLKNERMKIC